MPRVRVVGSLSQRRADGLIETHSKLMPTLGLGFGGRDIYGAIRTNSRTANPSAGDICARARIYRFRLGFPNLKFGSGINWL